MGRPKNEARVKEIEPTGIDFSTPIADTFETYGRTHPLPDLRYPNALSYLNEKYSFDDGMKFLYKYMEENSYPKQMVEAAKSGPKFAFGQTNWKLAKLILNGCKLPMPSLLALEISIADGLRKCSTVTEISAEVKSSRPSVQDHIANQAAEYYGPICFEVDKILKKQKSDFSAYNYFDSKGISAPAVGYIKKWLVGDYAESFKAVTGDKELREGYSFFSDKQLLDYSLFLKTMIEDCDRWQNNKKAIRKPRVKKVVSASKQLAKLKYQREFPELKVVSINPEQIIGATSLWLYNTKDRKLVVYHARTHDGFGVKGTTIQGFDEKLSIMKKVRKPELIVSKVIDGGKVVLKHLMENIKAVEQKAPSRINGFCILLRVGK